MYRLEGRDELIKDFAISTLFVVICTSISCTWFRAPASPEEARARRDDRFFFLTQVQGRGRERGDRVPRPDALRAGRLAHRPLRL
jgi:hypothetical protein